VTWIKKVHKCAVPYHDEDYGKGSIWQCDECGKYYLADVVTFSECTKEGVTLSSIEYEKERKELEKSEMSRMDFQRYLDTTGARKPWLQRLLDWFDEDTTEKP